VSEGLLCVEEVGEMKKVRVHVTMGQKSKELLDELCRKTGDSHAGVFRNALRPYAALIEESEKGSDIYTKDKDGNLTLYRVFV